MIIRKLFRVEILVVFILTGAFFVRFWRLDEILGFYYDQGRDALVIWDLIHNGKFFLIGPTTGIEGIFRGPWYYWLIAPFYLIGGGNPVWPSVFLSITTVAAIIGLYFLAKDVSGKTAGLLAVIIASFSFQFIVASRWLSNPTPMFLISMLLVLSMFMVLEKKRYAWPMMTFLAGLAMQFGSAAETFYIPAIIIFVIWQRKNLSLKVVQVALFAFAVPFIPQIIFDMRHNFILTEAIRKFIFEQRSFGSSDPAFIIDRLWFYFDVFNDKLFLSDRRYGIIFGLVLLLIIFIKRKVVLSNDRIRVLLVLILTPLLGLLFFRGNYGNIYDYYFTGYYLIFVLLFSSILGIFLKESWAKTIVVVFLLLFFQINLPMVAKYLSSDIHNPAAILFGAQKEAVDWVYEDAKNREFNVDVYVPPVIPYAYDYLFLWRGEKNYGKVPSENPQPLLYTLYEHDPPHPDRINAWLSRQEGIGMVEETTEFGAITVQRRKRI